MVLYPRLWDADAMGLRLGRHIWHIHIPPLKNGVRIYELECVLPTIPGTQHHMEKVIYGNITNHTIWHYLWSKDYNIVQYLEEQSKGQSWIPEIEVRNGEDLRRWYYDAGP